MLFGAHHEWGKLREVVIGISPAEDFVVFHEDSCRWLTPEERELRRRYAGRRLIDLDASRRAGAYCRAVGMDCRS